MFDDGSKILEAGGFHTGRLEYFPVEIFPKRQSAGCFDRAGEQVECVGRIAELLAGLVEQRIVREAGPESLYLSDKQGLSQRLRDDLDEAN